ncbi:hypothetical protein [Streptomyces sp. NPDC088725]|uniref:hypothetical protein n=1 Tax=Streptomyces sp. NPDC088725 TaxID=3365873 RepID=UPI003827AAD6
MTYAKPQLQPQAQQATPAARWLASSLTQPAVAGQDWRDGRPAILRTGIVFDAVRMPQELVHAAVRGTADATVAAALAATLRGPVIRDPGVWYYALVPPKTTENWRSLLATVRGRGSWLGVPRPDRTAPPGIHWSVPPETAGRVCCPDAVAELLRLGRQRLDDATP